MYESVYHVSVYVCVCRDLLGKTQPVSLPSVDFCLSTTLQGLKRLNELPPDLLSRPYPRPQAIPQPILPPRQTNSPPLSSPAHPSLTSLPRIRLASRKTSPYGRPQPLLPFQTRVSGGCGGLGPSPSTLISIDPARTIWSGIDAKLPC